MEEDAQHNLNASKDQLNKLYDKEDKLKKELIRLSFELEQLRENIQVTEILFMHQSNKIHRYKEWKKVNKQ